MKKCSKCGYKNKDQDFACNLCANKLPDQPTREASHGLEPRLWSTGAAKPERVNRTELLTERHYFVPPVGEPVKLDMTTTLLIGREEACHVRLASPKVSRKHAEIRWEGKKAFIVDLGTPNGTYVNEERLAPNGKRELRPGDVIGIVGITATYKVLAPGSDPASLVDVSGTQATMVHEEPREAGLVGTPAIMPIGQVLTRLSTLRASGTLSIEAAGSKGEFTIEGGKIVKSTYAGLSGGPAVTAATALTTGQFRFEERETGSKSNE
jgi:hypothetical protein